MALPHVRGIRAFSVTRNGTTVARTHLLGFRHLSRAALLDFARQLSASFAATPDGRPAIRVPGLMD